MEGAVRHLDPQAAPDALLNATIFFDFRSLYGKAELADAMRRHLLALTASNPMFLRAMAKNALDVEPPLGKIRDFLTDLEPEHPGKIDLKKYGSRIFVDVARIYAMASGVHNTNSIQRLRLASQRLNIRGMRSMRFSMRSISFSCSVAASIPGRRAGQAGRQPDRSGNAQRTGSPHPQGILPPARKIQTRLKLDYQVN
jgi:CBS domain-containing protein